MIESMPACSVGYPQFSMDGKKERIKEKTTTITTITSFTPLYFNIL